MFEVDGFLVGRDNRLVNFANLVTWILLVKVVTEGVKSLLLLGCILVAYFIAVDYLLTEKIEEYSSSLVDIIHRHVVVVEF